MRNFMALFYRNKKEKINVEKIKNLYILKSKGDISTIIVTTLGVNPEFLEGIIVTTKRKLSGKADRLIYLTDNSDFTVFRRHGVIFEYLPPLVAQRRHANDMPWQAYLREHWGLLLAKWRPSRVLTYGTSIDSLLTAAPSAIREAPEMPKS